MKKIITLVLAIALLMTSIVAIAETKATPNINSFATMTTKYNEGAGIITIKLSKPVDHLYVVWNDKSGNEELAVGEDGVATALTWGHKYMPGTKQVYNTWTPREKTTYKTDEEFLGYDVKTSEKVYKSTTVKTTEKGNWVTVKEGPARPLSYGDVDKQIAAYKAQYKYDNYEIVEPQKVTVNGVVTEYPGYIKGTSESKLQTVIATPADTAYITVQGEFAVYYNRVGKIVGIEAYEEGMF